MKIIKNVMKILIFFSILMFIFIQLPKPSIAPPPKYSTICSADTVYDTTPTATNTVPPNTMDPFTGAGFVDFICQYSFSNEHENDGSYHKVVFIVDRTQPTSNHFETGTGWIYINIIQFLM